MTKKNLYTIGALLLFMASFSQGGDSKLDKGDKLYDKYAYIKSIEVYEKVANRGYKSVELFEKLGDAYFFNSQYAEANKWYTELFKLNKTVDPIYHYRYSQTLKTVGDTKKADEQLLQFSKLSETDSRAKQYLSNKNYLAEIENNSNRYTIANADVNTSFSDYGTSIYKDTVVFTSTRIPEKGKANKDSWTSDYFSSLYSASLSKEGILSDVRFFSKEIQTQYHESSPVFSKDGKTIFFTRSNYLNKKKKTNSDKVVMLKIYKATFDNEKWGNITELPFNNDQYNCAHPALSPDEKTLYFVSDMPGGYGYSDIYKVAIGETNTFGSPINLGNNINTQGKETFPSISSNGELYFASDGHLGLGGLDVFVTNVTADNYSAKINNVGKPVNSEFDDFCYVLLNDSKHGFFTSNRIGGKGKDDVYRFVEQKKIELTTPMEGLLVDDETQKPIPNAIVTIYDKNHNPIASTKTDSEGRFKTVIDNSKGDTYYIKTESPDYDTQEVAVNSNKDDLKKVIVGIAKTKKAVTNGSDLAKTLNIKDILFDLDKDNIRPDAEVELQKVIQVMQDNPDVKITISSHTDSRHTHKYNLELSQRRAKNTSDYLISNGISGNRLNSKGYGETLLLNNCNDGVKCSEAEHQVNRRSAFIIDKI